MAQELPFDVLPPEQEISVRSGISLSAEQQAILARLEGFARLLDSAVRIPGINVRLGADSILGLALPGIGDAITAIAAGYVVVQARKLGLPPGKLSRMVANILLDTGVGAVPFAGDILDIVFKRNLRNVNIIREHFQLPPLTRR